MGFSRTQTIFLAACLLGAALIYSPVVNAGCTKDTDCKGDRVCNAEGRCVDPEPCPPCDCSESEDSTPAVTSPDVAPPPERPKVPDGSTLLITMTDESPTTGVEVSCPSGFRLRVSFEDRLATVPGVPAEYCSVHFKGPISARYQPVKGGQSLLCYIQGSTAVCE